jgi:hypothetical protein
MSGSVTAMRGLGARIRGSSRGVQAALGNARTVVNVGAGAGSYEPSDRHVIGIEPSDVMAAQRPSDRALAIRASARCLAAARRQRRRRNGDDHDPSLGRGTAARRPRASTSRSRTGGSSHPRANGQHSDVAVRRVHARGRGARQADTADARSARRLAGGRYAR